MKLFGITDLEYISIICATIIALVLAIVTKSWWFVLLILVGWVVFLLVLKFLKGAGKPPTTSKSSTEKPVAKPKESNYENSVQPQEQYPEETQLPLPTKQNNTPSFPGQPKKKRTSIRPITHSKEPVLSDTQSEPIANEQELETNHSRLESIQEKVDSLWNSQISNYKTDGYGSKFDTVPEASFYTDKENSFHSDRDDNAEKYYLSKKFIKPFSTQPELKGEELF